MYLLIKSLGMWVLLYRSILGQVYCSPSEGWGWGCVPLAENSWIGLLLGESFVKLREALQLLEFSGRVY